MKNIEVIKKFVITIISVYTSIFLSIIFLRIPLVQNSYILYSVPILIGLIGVPKVCMHYNFLHTTQLRLKTKITHLNVICILVIGSILVIKILTKSHSLDVIVQTGIIAISEEYLFRHVFINEDKGSLILIMSALAFAFIAHNNELFLVNLCLRFPIGLMLGFIYQKKQDYNSCVLLHFAYNFSFS